MCFKIDWASIIVGSKFTIFALFYLVFDSNFPSTGPQGAYIWRGDLTEGFLRYRRGLYMEGLIFRILQYMYYFYHKNILKTRVICCLTYNLQLTVT